MSVELLSVEERLKNAADVLLIDPRTLRQVIKLHRDVTGLVPHSHCYAIPRAQLARMSRRIHLDPMPAEGRDWVVLIARRSAKEISDDTSEDSLKNSVLQAAFHALVHARLEDKKAQGLLEPRVVKQRIELIGVTEFQEIRAAIKHDDLLLPPGSEWDVYVEFCALYLELREFSPSLLVTTFPGLDNYELVEDVIAADVDVDAILSTRRRPDSAPPSRRTSVFPASSHRQAPSDGAYRRLMHRAEAALDADQMTRAAILASLAAEVSEPDRRSRANVIYETATGRLSARLEETLRGAHTQERENVERWRETIRLLCRHRPSGPWVGRCPEDRVLMALQAAVHTFEEPGVLVDVPSWILSFGRRPIVRPRDVTRELQVARCIDSAAEKAQRVDLPAGERARVTEWLERASHRAEVNIRQALRPRILGVLRREGLTAESGPERQAVAKLAEELLDQVVERGFLSLAQLRDAVSRNEAKIADVHGMEALVRGDSLLRADAQLELSLDGVYRRGDVYLRWLQKSSGLFFGTASGRALSLYLALPALGAFTVLEAVRHLVGPVLVWLGFSPLQPLRWSSFVVTAACIFGLIHSENFRVVARQILDVVGVILAFVFLRVPRALLWRPAVRRWLERPAVRSAIRSVVVPATFAGLAYWLLPLRVAPLLPFSERQLRVLASLGVFLLTSFIMASRVGFWLEDLFVDRLAPTWQALSRQWIPQLLRLIGRAFSVSMDALERLFRRIDTALRFRRTRSSALLFAAGVAGCLWAAAAYAIRLYVTLLVEPEINPLKHFPVVTVAHKLILPFLPELLTAISKPLTILGPILGGTLAGLTVFLLPSVFGFLAWELKENYRLYRATRTKFVPAARLGPDGETMQGLLVPGIHSGTLPKLYDRLRRAARRREEQQSRRLLVATPQSKPAPAPELGRFRERLRVVERSVRRFAERELLPTVSLAPLWSRGSVRVQRVDLSSNRIRVRLVCDPSEMGPCELTFEQLGGWVVASVSRLGFVEDLEPGQVAIFENALAVLYHRAEVALVREQIDTELGSKAHYQVVDEGIVVWPGDAYETEFLYKLRRYRPGPVKPKALGQPVANPIVLDTRRVVYSHQRIEWRAWEEAWAAAFESDKVVPRLLAGPSILPRGLQRAVVV